MRKHKKKPHKRRAKCGGRIRQVLSVLADIATITGFILSLIKK